MGKQLAQDHTVRVVGSRFKSGNVCRLSLNFLFFIFTMASLESTNCEVDFDVGRGREM